MLLINNYHAVVRKLTLLFQVTIHNIEKRSEAPLEETIHQPDVEIENIIVEDGIGTTAKDAKIANDAVLPPIVGESIEDTANDVEIESKFALPIIDGVIEES